MIQYKIFAGTLDEIEAALNAWAASLPTGVNVNSGPLVQAGDIWLKEVMYVLPARSNGIAVPKPPLAAR